MAAKHLPKIEHKIRTVTELQAHHEEIARRAQTEEEASGEIAFECEEKTYQFTRHYSKMKRLHTLMMYVHRNGTLSPELLNSLMYHFKFHYDAEVENVKKYKTALALEKYLDTMFHHHTELASDLEPRRLALLRLREPEQEQEP